MTDRQQREPVYAPTSAWTVKPNEGVAPRYLRTMSKEDARRFVAQMKDQRHE